MLSSQFPLQPWLSPQPRQPRQPRQPQRQPRPFFTADTHFGHANIIKYCQRPFASTQEMDETIIANWNRVVSADDTVYHMGDFAMGCDLAYARDCFSRLNGYKHLIIGNHEKLGLAIGPHSMLGWETTQHYAEIEVRAQPAQLQPSQPAQPPQRIVLFHYGLRTWHHSYRGVWHLYGHSHGELDPLGKSLDIGVDCHNFTPVSFERLAELMATQPNVHEIAVENRWDKTNNAELKEISNAPVA